MLRVGMRRVGMNLKETDDALLFPFELECWANASKLIFIFECFQNYLQTMITSTVSPALKFGLRFLGMWPGVPYSTVYWLSFMFSMLIVQCFQYLYIFKHFKISEMSNLIDNLPVTFDYSLTCLKMTCLWINRR